MELVLISECPLSEVPTICYPTNLVSALSGPAIISLSKILKLLRPAVPELPPTDHTMANRNVPCWREMDKSAMKD